MLRVELKRILKTRSTWWLFAIAFVLCIFFAFYAVRLCTYYDLDENGTTQITRGTEAYEINKEKYSLIKGQITPELISEAVSVYQEIMAQYGDDYSVPPAISDKVLGPYSPVFNWILWSYTDENGERLSHADITTEQAMNFYQERMKTLKRTLEKKYEHAPQVVSYAMSQVNSEASFDYTYGIGATRTIDHLGTCIFLVTLICLMITAPIFSSDYASGADDILRSTRSGRMGLALAKLGSAIIISSGAFILCIGAFLVVVFGAFGFDDITSVELLNIPWNPDSLTAMGCIGIILLTGLISFLAISCFTLFLSSRITSPMTVLAISITVALIPTVILLTGADGNILNWIRFCLPSGGLLPSSAMLNELGSLRFLWIGDFVTWSPYVVLVAAAVQTPLWFGLALLSYNKHEAS